MDKSGRGFLKNEEVYGMMKDQLQMQKDLFKMKKVIAGYVHIARSCLKSVSLCLFNIIYSWYLTRHLSLPPINLLNNVGLWSSS